MFADEEWQSILVSAYKIVVCSPYNKAIVNLILSFLFFSSMNLVLKCFSQPKCFPKLDRHAIACEIKLSSKMGRLMLTLPVPLWPVGQLPVCSSVQRDSSFLTDFLPLPNIIIWRPSCFPEISSISQMVSRVLFKITGENSSRLFGLISLIIFPVDFFFSLWIVRNEISWLLHNHRD